MVFSLEKPKAKLLPFKGPNGEDADPTDYQVGPPPLFHTILHSVQYFGHFLNLYVLWYL